MADLRGHDRLRPRRQRRVPHRDLLVVREVAGLLLRGEGDAPEVHGQHEVSLLHHLLAVQVEVREVQQQRVLIGSRRGEVPARVVRVPFALLVDAEARVERHHDPRRGVTPRRRLFHLDAQLVGEVGMALDHLRRGPQVLLGHEVRVDVVVDERVVLVGTGDAVDAEPPSGVVVAEAAPQPGRLHEDGQRNLALERHLAGRVQVAQDRVTDVSVDVEGRGARGPVAGRLPPPDRAPGKRGADEVEGPRVLHGLGDRELAPAQRVGGHRRLGVRQDREHVGLGVPEGVTVVPRPGQALGRDGPSLRPRARLEDGEQREAHRLLYLRVTVDLDVGTGPELVEARTLLLLEPVPPGEPRARQRGDDLVVHCRARASRRPAVREVLHQAQALPLPEATGHGQPAHVGIRLRAGARALRALDLVVHRRAQEEPAALGAVHRDRPQALGEVLLGHERRVQQVLTDAAGHRSRWATPRWSRARTGRRRGSDRRGPRPRSGSRPRSAGSKRPIGSR